MRSMCVRRLCAAGGMALALTSQVLVPAQAASLRFGALLLRAADLGPGYYESGTGYSRTRSGIMQPGFPLPGQQHALRHHGFVAEFFTGIYSHKVVNNTVVTSIRSAGDQFLNPAGAHWAFIWTQTHVRQAGLYQRRISLPAAVGNESYGIVPPDGDPGRGIIFRQGRYLIQIVVFHRPPQLTTLVTLAARVAGRLKTRG